MLSERLVERMGSLARDLRSEPSGEDTLDHVVRSAVDLVPACETAGISLARRRGDMSTSASTSDIPTRSDKLQQQFDEGPCIDAIWKERVVTVADLTTEDRWPRWAERAHSELGIGSMVCVQLFTHEDRVGALNMFASVADAFDASDIDVGLAIAAHAAVAVAAAQEIDNLQLAVAGRTVMGQATGLLMERFRLSDHAAFELLRRLSMEQNTRLSYIAETIVESHNGQLGDM